MREASIKADEQPTPTPREALDIQAIVARIDRDLVESRRAREEADKLMAELRTEERKLRRVLWPAPWALVGAVLGGVIVALARRLIGG